MNKDDSTTKRMPVPEQRQASRYEVCLPFRILSVGGHTVDWSGRTRNMSAGGVSFVVPDALVIGSVVEYVITLSSNNPPVRISCLGKILRCTKSDDGQNEACYEAAATMERYGFITGEDVGLGGHGTTNHQI
jgi:hypothetical protein